MSQNPPRNAPLRIVIEGAHIRDIPSFYAEINRVFMAGESWQLGETLDGLNDLLHGGYGTLTGAASALVLWRDMEVSRAALGAETTLAFLRERLTIRSQFNGAPIADQIRALEAGGGKTYFDIVMDVFADHPDIAVQAR